LLPLLLLLALPASVQAQFTFTTNSGAITITGYTGSGGGLAIPSTINGLPVISIADEAFLNADSLTSVTIPSSVTNIGYEAFLGCQGLTTLTIGTNVTSIGYSAFWNCSSLTTVTIPSSVTSIGGYAFSFCTSLNAITVDALNSVYSSAAGVLFDRSQTTLIQYPGGEAGSYTIPNSVTTIGDRAFANCTRLTSVTLGSSVTNIGSDAFYYCTSLSAIRVDALNSVYSSVAGVLFDKSQTALIQCPEGQSGAYTIPNSVTRIEEYAFYNCASLTNVTIGTNVSSIGDYTFLLCSSLTSVTIPGSVSSIGDYAFSFCTSLTAITVDTNNPAYSSVAGVLFNKSQTTLVEYPSGKARSYTMPNSVTSIGNYAFYECYSLTNVTIGSSVTNIGEGAFIGCTGLTSVTIPNGVSSIGAWAFSSCSSLTSVAIPNGVTSIGFGAFDSCTSLANVTIPNSVTFIGDQAFDSCTSLTSVTIGNRVASLGDYAFLECTSLTGVYFQGNAPSLGYAVFEYDNNAAVYYLAGTTGWASTFGGCPAVFWNPRVQASGAGFGVRTNRFGFSITGTAGLVVVVEACTNLASPVWYPLQTITLTGGPVYFSDPGWTNYTRRFYGLGVP
jgi:hypothetical protein